MKAIIHSLTFTLALALLASCSSSRPQAGLVEYDDMYYTSSDRELSLQLAREHRAEQLQAQAEREKTLAQQKNIYRGKDAETARQLNPDAAEGYGSDEEYYEDEYYEEGYYEEEAAPVYNYNFYRESNFYDPWMAGASMYRPYNRGWGSPWNSGFRASFGFNSGWGYDPFFDPFYDPFFHTSSFYSPWGFNSWHGYNPYARGYRHGFYDGYWNRRNLYGGSYYPGVVVLNGERNVSRADNVFHGPRSVRTGNRVGVGQREVRERTNTRGGANLRERDNSYRGRSGNENGRTVSPTERRRSDDSWRNHDSKRNNRKRSVSPTPERRQNRSYERSNDDNRKSRQRSRDNNSNYRRSRDNSPSYQRSTPSRSRDNSPSHQRSTPSRSRDNNSGNTRSRSRGGNNLSQASEQPASNLNRSRHTQGSAVSAPAPQKRQEPVYRAPERQTESRSRSYSAPAKSSSSSFSSTPSYQKESSRSSSSRSRISRSSSGSNTTRSSSRSRGGN